MKIKVRITFWENILNSVYQSNKKKYFNFYCINKYKNITVNNDVFYNISNLILFNFAFL